MLLANRIPVQGTHVSTDRETLVKRADKLRRQIAKLEADCEKEKELLGKAKEDYAIAQVVALDELSLQNFIEKYGESIHQLLLLYSRASQIVDIFTP